MQIHTVYYHHPHPFSFFIPQSSSPSLFPRQFNPQFKSQSKPQSKRPSPILSSSSPSSSNNNKANPNSTLSPFKQQPELLTKPEKPPENGSDDPTSSSGEPERPSEDFGEALAPFLKFFKQSESESDDDEETADFAPTQQLAAITPEITNEIANVKYYEPKRGDLVVGVVVSGNENKLDVNVGADLLGTMLTKEVMPLYSKELDYLLCDLVEEGEELARGRMGVVRDEEALSRNEKAEGRPVVEVGTVVFAEVLGRTLSGRPLLSSRRMYRQAAWHRVRQIQQLNEPIEVKIFEWNTGGLLTRIEGLRAFIPKAELMNRVNSFMDLKENVGRRLYVNIVRVDETTNDLIISEKEAWDMLNLKEGTLLEGTVRKIFPYGAQVRIRDTNRSGLLHISNITRARVTSVSDVLEVGEKLKVLVVKSMIPGKISLSIADLESEHGLFLSDKEKVFSDAEEMARRYRQRLPVVSLPRKQDPFPTDVLPFDDEARLYANWRWFKFEQHKEVDANDDANDENAS